MLALNLLPWRDIERTQRKTYWQRFILSMLVSGIIFLIGLHCILAYFIVLKEKELRAVKIETEQQAKWLQPIKNKQVLAVIYHHALQMFSQEKKKQNQLLDWFNLLIQTTPQGVSFTELQYHDKGICLLGDAHSAADLSQFIAVLTKHRLFKKVQLEKFKKERDAAVLHFKITLEGSAP